ncbi:methyltransferase [Streptomyces sp. 2A115]|uniref:methyltransferase n=1 Tax=Streptomyces sp. 2A115 TaxID=3457439 RepID=UPI003FCFAE66
MANLLWMVGGHGCGTVPPSRRRTSGGISVMAFADQPPSLIRPGEKTECEFTLEELIELIETHAGEPDEGELDVTVVDVLFQELGYDSIRLLEVISQIKQRYGLDLAEEILAEMRTPRQILDAINGLLRSREHDGMRTAMTVQMSPDADAFDLSHNDASSLHAQQLLLLACGGRLARVVYALGELGVADVVADGPLDIDTIAEKTGAHADSLYRVMRCAASVGIFVEGPTRTFGLTPLADGLRSDNANGVLPLVKYNNIELTHRPFDEILRSVKTGERSFERTLGVSFPEYLSANPEVGRFFDQFMSFWSRQFVEEELEQYRFERFSSLADLGGGDGFFLAQVLKRNPEMTAYLYDYPSVVAKAAPLLEEFGVRDRVQIDGGDLTGADVPAGYDAYLLKAVLHWQSDEQAEGILRQIRRRMGDDSDARLLVFDSVLDPGNAWDHGKFLDVDMLVLFGGRERTFEDWTALLRRGGFELVGQPNVFHWTLLEARPV